MRFRPRRHTVDPNLRQVVAAARLYAEGKTQQEIADKLGKKQSTISRWLKEAHHRNIIQTRIDIRLPDLFVEEDQFRSHFPEIDRIYVVPDGIEKNVANLSSRAAEVIADAICEFDKEIVSMVFASGDTVRRTVYEFFDLLDYDEDRKNEINKKTLKLYPASFHADYRIKPIYPSSAVLLFNVLSLDILGIENIEAYVVALPPKFFDPSFEDARKTY